MPGLWIKALLCIRAGEGRDQEIWKHSCFSCSESTSFFFLAVITWLRCRFPEILLYRSINQPGAIIAIHGGGTCPGNLWVQAATWVVLPLCGNSLLLWIFDFFFFFLKKPRGIPAQELSKLEPAICCIISANQGLSNKFNL